MYLHSLFCYEFSLNAGHDCSILCWLILLFLECAFFQSDGNRLHLLFAQWVEEYSADDRMMNTPGMMENSSRIPIMESEVRWLAS